MTGSGPLSFIRFATVGVINTFVGLAIVVVTIRVFGLNPFVANGFGFMAGIVVGYLLNRQWTFGSTRGVAATGPRYVLVFFVSYAVNVGILAILLGTRAVDPILAQAAALVGYSVVFYVLCRTLVFRADR